MIAFFPDAYPDELLYSQLARYYKRSGYVRYAYAVSDLYKNDTTVFPSFEFVNQYTPDAMSWIVKNKPWEQVIADHTMYPAYIRFLPKLRRQEALKGLITCEGNWRNLMCMPTTGEKRYMRYCPVCALEDREKYGETFWHREHQIQRIRVCPKHRCYLENTSAVVSSKSSPGLHDAETLVPFYSEPRLCSNIREIGFTQYLIKVMREPVDMDNPLPIGRFLHSKLSSEYLNDAGTIRNISNLYTDYLSFYGDMTIMTQTYMQKIFNGYQHDPYFVLQLAFFENISVQDITQLPKKIELYGIEAKYKELADKLNLDYSVVEAIGSSVLKYNYNQTHVTRKTGPRRIDYDEIDIRAMPQVTMVVRNLLEHDDRPEKVSFAKVQKALGLPQKAFNNMPRCRSYIEKHIESQAEYWAREVDWAIGKIMRNGDPITLSRIMKMTNMRVRDIASCCPYIRDVGVQQIVRNMLDLR